MPKTASSSLIDVYLCRRSSRATYYTKSSLHFWLNRFGGWGGGGGYWHDYGSFVCMLGAGVGGRIPFYLDGTDRLFVHGREAYWLKSGYRNGYAVAALQNSFYVLLSVFA